MFDSTAATTYEDATPQERGTMIEQLRRVLALSDTATIEDINRKLIELDEFVSNEPITALSAIRCSISAEEEEVRRRIGVHPDVWRRFNG